MQISLHLCKDFSKFSEQVILVDASTKFSSLGFDKTEVDAIQKYFDDKIGPFYRRVADGKTVSIVKIDTAKEEFKMLEEARKAGSMSHKNDGNRQSGSDSGSSRQSGGGGSSGGSGGGTRGGTPEQHAEAGRQSHKNDDKR